MAILETSGAEESLIMDSVQQNATKSKLSKGSVADNEILQINTIPSEELNNSASNFNYNDNLHVSVLPPPLIVVHPPAEDNEDATVNDLNKSEQTIFPPSSIIVHPLGDFSRNEDPLEADDDEPVSPKTDVKCLNAEEFSSIPYNPETLLLTVSNGDELPRVSFEHVTNVYRVPTIRNIENNGFFNACIHICFVAFGIGCFACYVAIFAYNE